jgi:Protein of unknown function (DUF3306)
MSEAEGFAARWSRLKRENDSGKKDEPKTPPGDASPRAADIVDAEATQARPKPGNAAEVPFDPATLPSIDSIMAGSDIRAFLQSGVPAELTKAALRRAWTTDPAIRDFIGLAENQWDFTDPTSIPGFGPLRPGDDIGQLVAQAMGKLPDAPEVPPAAMASTTGESGETLSAATTRPEPAIPQVSGTQHEIETEAEQGQATNTQERVNIAASQHVDRLPTDSLSNRRGHGGALPK